MLSGLGHHNKSSCPVLVGGDLAGVKVQQVVTYGDCSLAVSTDGQLYGWGNSEYLQLASVTEMTQVLYWFTSLKLSWCLFLSVGAGCPFRIILGDKNARLCISGLFHRLVRRACCPCGLWVESHRQHVEEHRWLFWTVRLVDLNKLYGSKSSYYNVLTWYHGVEIFY